MGIFIRRSNMKAVGPRIKTLRGPTLQEGLAGYLDITQGHLSKIECGKDRTKLRNTYLAFNSISQEYRLDCMERWSLAGLPVRQIQLDRTFPSRNPLR